MRGTFLWTPSPVGRRPFYPIRGVCEEEENGMEGSREKEVKMALLIYVCTYGSCFLYTTRLQRSIWGKKALTGKAQK